MSEVRSRGPVWSNGTVPEGTVVGRVAGGDIAALTAAQVLTMATTGSSNVGAGYATQYALTTGSANAAIGYATQYALTTGSANVGAGYTAQYALTTGSANVGIGYTAQCALTTGSANTAIGHAAQYAPKGDSAGATTTALRQTSVGAESGAYAAASGDKGCALGYRALHHTGAVALGADAEAQGVNSIAIGIGAVATADNTIQLGAVGTAYTAVLGSGGRLIALTELKSIVAAAADFAAFKTAVAALS